MDIDKILLKICTHLGKESTYKGTLKRSYNVIDKDHKAGGLDKLIPDQAAYEQINILGVLKKYKIDPKLIETFITEDIEEEEFEEFEEIEEITLEDLETFEEEQDLLDEVFPDEDELDFIESPKESEFDRLVKLKMEEMKGLISREGAEFIVKKELEIEYGETGLIITEDINFGAPTPKKSADWQSLFNTVKEDNRNADGEYEKFPSLTLVDNATYYLKLVNPKETAEPLNITDNWNNELVKYIIKVSLAKISPAELYDMTYRRGDFKGNDCFVNGTIYNLWLEEERMFKPFVRFWRDILGILPDKRIFILRKTKKMSKNQRLYNVFKFSEYKKRK